MAKHSRRDRRAPDDAPGGLTHNPFKSLRAQHGGDSEAADAQQASHERSGRPAVDPVAAPLTDSDGPIVVRREKKGRAGKTVTRISGLALAPDALGELVRELKRALGCGASVDGPDVLLQGALVERTATWLRTNRGVDVTVGN